MSLEIERKFLLSESDIPQDLRVLSASHIMQGYLATGDEELRIRAIDFQFFLTLKKGTGIQREEHEFEISKETFTKLSKGINMLSKKRIKVRLSDGNVAEIDFYWGLPEKLMTVEVEFKNMDDAVGFIPPDWFGEEVTGDKKYSNAYLITLL